MSRDLAPPTLLKAEDESRRARSFFVGTEHLFLAILREGSPEVSKLLTSRGIDINRAVDRVRGLLNLWQPDENWSGLLQPTARVRRISQRATVLAEQSGGQRPEACHYLAALLEDDMGHTARAVLGRRPLTKARLKREPEPVADVDRGMQMTFETERDDIPGAAKPSRRSILEHFGRDLTQLARDGSLSPSVGRQRELDMLMRTLARQTKPNPLVIGEPGTGKSALVEGLAQAIVRGEVVPMLKDAKVIELSLSTVVAGTQYRGEFEKRLELIVEELKQRTDVILFLDEFHLAVGAGAGAGGMDAANILKPALARGDFRCIAATTLREYRKHIEPDAALSRRFQTIVLEQPDRDATLLILQGIKPRFEQHHGVSITDDAIRSAVEFSDRFEPDRNQPDKAIDLLDDACTRASQPSVSSTAATTEPVATTESATNPAEKSPLVVTREHVAQAIADRTGIPLSLLSSSDLERLAGLETVLAKSIKGQAEAVATVTNALREIRLGLRDENRPNGVFLFTGPSGVGKTALAECLAKEYFGISESMIRIDLSEYTQPHTVSRLIGAPPGYIGHDEKGQLTRALRTRPHSLVLLDEIEKAHPQIFDVFLQVFGSGRLTDGRGDTVDCRQAMFVMTSNIGAEAYGDSQEIGFRSGNQDQVARNEAVLEACAKQFRREFMNRIDRIVCFNPLTPAVLREILDGLIATLLSNLQSHEVALNISDDVRKTLVRKSGTKLGVPPLQRLLRDEVMNAVTQWMVRESVRPLRLEVVARNSGFAVDIEQESKSDE